MSNSLYYHVPERSARPPRLYVFSLPAAEQITVDLVNGRLSELASYVDDFHAALELFEFSDAKAGHIMQTSESIEDNRKRETLRRWKFIAAKDGAMTIYHFGQTLDALRGGLKDCPTVRAMVDIHKLRSADRSFDRDFPNYVKLRHSVAHQTEVAAAPFAMTKNDGSGYGQVIVTGSMLGRRFMSLWNGHRVEYDIAEITLQTLASIRDCVYEAFSDAESKLRAGLPSAQ